MTSCITIQGWDCDINASEIVMGVVPPILHLYRVDHQSSLTICCFSINDGFNLFNVCYVKVHIPREASVQLKQGICVIVNC